MSRTKLGLYFIALLSIITFACTGSKKYAKKAEKFEENGFYKQAADYYFISLRKKNTNIDARIGLIKNGQKVMDDYLREFFMAHSSEDYKKSVYSYIKVQNYYRKINETGVELKIPNYYQGYYDEDLKVYLSNQYDKGTELLSSGNYDQSDAIFTEINRLDPDFRDADKLAILSKAEPLYIKAEASFDKEHYREAYKHYTSVLKLDKNYKEASEKREYAHKKAMLTIAVLSENQFYPKETQQLNAYVSNQLVDANNPFLTIIDRSNVDKIVEEQKIGMNGTVNQNIAVSAGNLMGAKVVLLGKIVNMKKTDGRLNSKTVEAYKKVSYQVYDKSIKANKTHIRYDKTNYTSHYQKNVVELSYQYKLISVETGQVLRTGVYSDNIDDVLDYASYSGNLKELYPKPNATSSEKINLDRHINGKKTIKSTDQLIINIYNSISKQVSNKVIDYEKSRL